jgi:hypothetical protein
VILTRKRRPLMSLQKRDSSKPTMLVVELKKVKISREREKNLRYNSEKTRGK